MNDNLWIKTLLYQPEIRPAVFNGNMSRLHDEMPRAVDFIKLKIKAIESNISSFKEDNTTTLDILLKNSLRFLAETLIEYARMLEKVLLLKKTINQSENKNRDLYFLVNAAQEKHYFYGGNNAVKIAEFLKLLDTTYTSNIDDRDYVHHLYNLKREFEILGIFILRN